MSKYRNVKVTTPDGKFDSKRELKRWQELKLLEKAKQIFNLRRQVKYELIPKQRHSDDTMERAVTYVADFVYTASLHTVVEDCKGFRTPEYVIKRKLMLRVHGITVKEV